MGREIRVIGWIGKSESSDGPGNPNRAQERRSRSRRRCAALRECPPPPPRSIPAPCTGPPARAGPRPPPRGAERGAALHAARRCTRRKSGASYTGAGYPAALARRVQCPRVVQAQRSPSRANALPGRPGTGGGGGGGAQQLQVGWCLRATTTAQAIGRSL
jgi:hypothetical protein